MTQEGRKKNPSIPNRSRTYDIPATSTKLQETRGSEGHKTSSLRSSGLEVMGSEKNGTRERNTRGKRERLPLVAKRLWNSFPAPYVACVTGAWTSYSQAPAAGYKT